MAGLMVGNETLAVGEAHACGFLHSNSLAVNSIVDLIVCYRFLAITCCHDRCFVHEIGKASTRESSSSLGDYVEVEVGSKGLSTDVYLQDLHASFHIWKINGDTAVES